MSGHSKWAKTHRQKQATDAKKGMAFTKIANLITIASREGGGDINANFKLRLLAEKARAANMPKENVERAIKRGTGEGADGKVFEEVTYEIFGPSGTKFIVEALTDNKNRTVGEIKTILNKNGGQLGALNSVSWIFNRLGVSSLEADQLKDKNHDDLELVLIDAGAQDIEKNEDGWEIRTAPENLNQIVVALKSANLEPKESSIVYLPKEIMSVTDEDGQNQIDKFYNLLDDLDDVTNVYTNADW
ncbi:MAG: YebC/PmpR family DNA-binding transcriptional regulator [bacterium]